MKEVTKGTILKIVNSIIQDTDITETQFDSDLQELGMESIAFIHIIVSLEEEFECEIPDAKLLLTEMNTINKIFDILISIGKSNDELK